MNLRVLAQKKLKGLRVMRLTRQQFMQAPLFL